MSVSLAEHEISGIEEVRGVIDHHHQEGIVYKSDQGYVWGRSRY